MSESEEIVKQQTALGPVYDYGADAGIGYEGTTSDDFAVPFLNLLQGLSPQVQPGDGAAEGAKPGMLLNSVTNELYGNSVVIVPVMRQHLFVEWTPRKEGGGLIARHEPDSPFIRDAKAAATRAKAPFGKLSTRYEGDRPAGNDLIETYYLFALRLAGEAEMAEHLVIGFSSTKVKVYKRLMAQVRAQPGNPPLFANRVKIGVVSQRNQHGTFYNFTATPAVLGPDGKPSVRASLLDPESELIEIAKGFRQMIDSGAASMAEEDRSGGSDEDAAGGAFEGGDAPVDGDRPF